MTANDAPSRSQPFYVSTAIPYVNAAPHVGFAYEAVLADALARHQRLCGRPGAPPERHRRQQPEERAGGRTRRRVARRRWWRRTPGGSPALGRRARPVVRRLHPHRRPIARHREGVEALWRACARAGDLYRRPYRGLYCVGCEGFFDAGELRRRPLSRARHRARAGRGGELVLSPVALPGAPGLRLIEAGHLQHRPPLAPQRGAGVPGRRPRGHQRVAGAGPGARLGHPGPGRSRAGGLRLVRCALELREHARLDRRRRRPTGGSGPARGRRLHVLGKGILRFHAVHWPAILLSAGLPLPTDLLVHGYLTVDGRKIGKSLGNAVDPEALVARHGAEAVRHYLLRHIRAVRGHRLQRGPTGRRARRRAGRSARQPGAPDRHPRAAELAPAPPAGRDRRGRPDDTLRAHLQALPGRLEGALAGFAADEALAAVFESVAAANRYLEQTAPWTLARRRRRSPPGRGRGRGGSPRSCTTRSRRSGSRAWPWPRSCPPRRRPSAPSSASPRRAPATGRRAHLGPRPLDRPPPGRARCCSPRPGPRDPDSQASGSAPGAWTRSRAISVRSRLQSPPRRYSRAAKRSNVPGHRVSAQLRENPKRCGDGPGRGHAPGVCPRRSRLPERESRRSSGRRARCSRRGSRRRR